jgi:hypothetical protein
MPTNAIRHFNAPFNNTTNTFNPMRSEPQRTSQNSFSL